jgi:hypothetical protein
MLRRQPSLDEAKKLLYIHFDLVAYFPRIKVLDILYNIHGRPVTPEDTKHYSDLEALEESLEKGQEDRMWRISQDVWYRRLILKPFLTDPRVRCAYIPSAKEQRKLDQKGVDLCTDRHTAGILDCGPVFQIRDVKWPDEVDKIFVNDDDVVNARAPFSMNEYFDKGKYP